MSDLVQPDPSAADVWWVASLTEPDRRRRVQVIRDEDGSVLATTCDCPHGLNNPGRARCRHVELAQQ